MFNKKGCGPVHQAACLGLRRVVPADDRNLARIAGLEVQFPQFGAPELKAAAWVFLIETSANRSALPSR